MGDVSSAERGLFALGTADDADTGSLIFQNDVKVIAGDAGMGGFINDGIGHFRASATPLPKIGTAVDFNLAKGVIVPASSSNPVPKNGSANWAFNTSGGSVSLTANSGEEFITPGTADPGATLKTLLTIYDSLMRSRTAGCPFAAVGTR